MSYACEKSFGDAPTCKMKIGKKILMQEIDRTQLGKLLTEKKSDLLRGFVSMRTRRKFSAYLVVGADGKTSFEFEPRKEGAPGKKSFFKKRPAPEANGHAAKDEAAEKPKKAPRKRKKTE